MMHLDRKTYRPAGRTGFTLIELLIVMAILAILVSLSVAVGRYISEESSRKRTQTALKMIKTALEQYVDEYRDYPPDRDPDGDDTSTEVLLDSLWKSDAAREILEKIDPEIFTGRDNSLYDSWGTKMQYDRDGGSGGTALIVSAGPDKKFDGDNAEDNIRSDFD
ncbi:MAG: type II secretion system protein [Phycisphaerae bacterium]